MVDPNLLAEAPTSDQLVAYDEQHLTDYLRLIDADDEGADWREVVTVIFNVDPEHDLEKARRFHETHLARARWMTRAGYLQLAARGREKPPKLQK